ncbi:DUF1091 domain containing protein [Asbolus verrucosus]|uniref:DUF1091 domain containing protein n=1 Tax=Asbolus verrucosus TaxID=1661398 RepID=A0A482WD32_ASBVE|nr:DUF1091 domain containing protein [Asbolus verrucosus]
MELISYNEAYVSDVLLQVGKINRTTVALNVSFNVLQDVLDQKLVISGDAERLYRTQYKKTGIKVVMNLCKFINTNMFGIRDMLLRYGNVDGCNFAKGHYYIKNLVPDTNNFPKYIPHGSYRTDTTILWENAVQMSRMMCYWTIQPL